MSKVTKAGKALKEMIEESPEVVQKILRSLKGESDDAVTKLGSGKNLEKLEQAKKTIKADIPVQPSIDTPYPKNIQQDDLGQVNKEFQLVGEPQSKDFTMPHPEASVPAVRGNTLPEVVPEVMDGPMLPAVRQNTLPQGIVDADIGGDKTGLYKKLGIGATGIAGALGIANMVGGDEHQQKADAMPILPIVAAAATHAGVNNLMNPKQPELPRSPAVEKTTVAGPKDVPAEAPAEETSPYLSDLDKAQKKQNELDFIDNLLRAGITGGAAISRTKADYSGVDALQKQNGKGVQNVKDKMEADHTDKKLKKEQTELNDDKLLRDPKSDVSKAFRSALAKLGVPHSDKTTAADAKAMGINIQNLLMHKETLAAAAAKTDAKGDAKDDKMIQSFRKELTSGEVGKLYNAYSTAQRTNDMVNEFAKNPTGYSDYGTLMNSLKTLQGDASTVREAEMKLGMESGSLVNKYQNVWSKAKNGQSLQPQQRQDIINATRILTEIAQKNYLHAAKPVLEQAARLNFSRQELLNEGLSDSDKKEASSETKPAAMVTVTRKADGKTLQMDSAKASTLDKTKYDVR